MSGFKDMMITIYGVIMGTSTPLLKSSRRPLFVIRRERINPELELVLGGSGNQLILQTPAHWLIVNTNSGTSGMKLVTELRGQYEAAATKPQITVVVQADTPEYSALVQEWSNEWKTAEVLSPETTGDRKLQVGGYDVQIRKSDFVTGGELRVEIPACRMLLMGPLFYAHLHPALRFPKKVRVAEWVKTLREIAAQYSDWRFVPGEGAVSEVSAVQEFAKYIEALADPGKDFSYCREHFDWPEIQGFTSLEENFDLLKAAKP